MNKKLSLLACSLDGDQMAGRVEEFRTLFSTSLISSEQIPGGARLRYPLAVGPAVRDLLAREQQCCTFWTFRFDETDSELVVTATAPLEAEPIVRQLLALR